MLFHKNHAEKQFQTDGYFEQSATQEQNENQNTLSLGSNSSSGLELKIVKPKTFVEATTIADYIINGNTIYLVLEELDSTTSRRILDFLTGVIYVKGNQLKKVEGSTFIIAPSEVDISDPSVIIP